MSNIYSTEPKTSGVVILNTTYGPLTIELWTKECPLTCRNFIQLCLEGHYDNSIFHRLVPGFCLQGGKLAQFAQDDNEELSNFPSQKFPIEIHSRLKFNRRGLLGMVAPDSSDPNSSNGCQFFFTLSEASELNGRTTLFGRLANGTIFNLLRMSELDVNPETEMPLFPPKIINSEVILNPFSDIIPRERKIVKNELNQFQQELVLKNQSILSKKNISLLSFADETEILPTDRKERNYSHSFPIEPSKVIEPKVSSDKSSSNSLQFLQQMKSVQMNNTIDKIKKVQEELGFKSSEKNCFNFSEEEELTQDKNISALEKYKTRFEREKKRKSTFEIKDDIDTILLLNNFRQKIHKSENPKEIAPDFKSFPESHKKYMDICKLHGLLNCLSCRDTFNIDFNVKNSEVYDEKDWMMHKLVFDRRELEGQVRDDLKDLVVIDPREKQMQFAGLDKKKKPI